MKIAVISDTHLGRGDESDHFGNEDGRFLKFLDFLESEFEQIVLLGDIFETITSPKYGAKKEELRSCFYAHYDISRRFFESAQYRYIHGNHDLIAAKVMGAPGEYAINIDGLRILFTHGHLYDFLVCQFRLLAEFIVWLGGHLNRIGLGMVYDYFAAMDNGFLEPSKHARRCKFQEWALDMAYTRDADLIVTGHTHHGRCIIHGEKIFMNSGTCINGNFQFLSIDTHAAEFAYHQSW